jgi:hypothetical protein
MSLDKSSNQTQRPSQEQSSAAVTTSSRSAEFEHFEKQIPHMAYPKPQLPKQSFKKSNTELASVWGCSTTSGCGASCDHLRTGLSCGGLPSSCLRPTSSISILLTLNEFCTEWSPLSRPKLQPKHPRCRGLPCHQGYRRRYRRLLLPGSHDHPLGLQQDRWGHTGFADARKGCWGLEVGGSDCKLLVEGTGERDRSVGIVHCTKISLLYPKRRLSEPRSITDYACC